MDLGRPYGGLKGVEAESKALVGQLWPPSGMQLSAVPEKQRSNMKKPGPRFQCKLCLDIIQSKHCHDFVRCRCEATAVDGGSDYTKLVNPEDLVRVEDQGGEQ